MSANKMGDSTSGKPNSSSNPWRKPNDDSTTSGENDVISRFGTLNMGQVTGTGEGQVFWGPGSAGTQPNSVNVHGSMDMNNMQNFSFPAFGVLGDSYTHSTGTHAWGPSAMSPHNDVNDNEDISSGVGGVGIRGIFASPNPSMGMSHADAFQFGLSFGDIANSPSQSGGSGFESKSQSSNSGTENIHTGGNAKNVKIHSTSPSSMPNAWYNNLPQGGEREQQLTSRGENKPGSGTPSPGVPCDLEFLSTDDNNISHNPSTRVSANAANAAIAASANEYYQQQVYVDHHALYEDNKQQRQQHPHMFSLPQQYVYGTESQQQHVFEFIPGTGMTQQIQQQPYYNQHQPPTYLQQPSHMPHIPMSMSQTHHGNRAQMYDYDQQQQIPSHMMIPPSNNNPNVFNPIHFQQQQLQQSRGNLHMSPQKSALNAGAALYDTNVNAFVGGGQPQLSKQHTPKKKSPVGQTHDKKHLGKKTSYDVDSKNTNLNLGATKSKYNKQQQSPHQTPHNQPQDDPNSSAARKRAELVESPSTRLKFKEFYRQFRLKEKESFEAAQKYAIECLQPADVRPSGEGNDHSLPEELHWRIYLEMADLAKRENRFTEARRLYRTVNKLQPYAPQGWLEYSKMEEECGRLHHCQKILHEGLQWCNFSESLLTKAIKHEERMGNLVAARALLGRLRHVNVDKAWRTILEGALLEARAGNVVVARKVFKYLMRNVPWYGPIYYEAARFEEKNEEFTRAISIVESGLSEIPRYGPLWFNAFRLHESMERMQAINELKAHAKRSTSATVAGINGTTVGGNRTNKVGKHAKKVQILAANVHENDNENPDMELYYRFGIPTDVFPEVPEFIDLMNTRGALQRAMNCISKELVWKVHFEAAQVAERGGGDDWVSRARAAYVQSVLRCPNNLRWKVWLAGVRTELANADCKNNFEVDLAGVQKAQKLLNRALMDVPDKSRAQVLLECSRVEEYIGNVDKARGILAKARKETKHEWKVFLESVMLEVRCGNREGALKEAKSALDIHSGTGRLWAILVQLTHTHGPDQQRLVFREALKQVPKSGEVWCEGARVHLHPLSPHYDLETASRYLEFAIQFTPQYGDSFVEALRFHLLRYDQSTGFTMTDEEYKKCMEERIDTRALEQRCVNADPNYGALWFHCKRGPFDTARQVLRTAKKLLIAELVKFRNVYKRAYLDQQAKKINSGSNDTDEDINDEQKREDKQRTTPALVNAENEWIIDRLDDLPGAENVSSGQNGDIDFSTGLCSVNWIRERVASLSLSEKRKILFGSDTIVP